MDLNEISTFSHRKQKISRKFCLRTSPCGRFYCLMLLDSAVVRKITHSPIADISVVNFQVNSIKCPEGIATQNLPRDFEAIYDSASFEQRTSMVLNPMMCIKTVENVSISLIDLQISPCISGKSDVLLAAVQNSMGCLYFYVPQQMEREWRVVLDVSKEIIVKRRNNMEVIKTYSDLKTNIQSHTISAFSWTMTDQESVYKFCVLMQSGVAVFCTFDGQKLEIDFESDLLIPDANRIKWFHFHGKSYVISSVVSGEIYLFRVDEQAKECIGVATLWTDTDYLQVDHLEVNTTGEDALLFAVKDCFLITFTLSEAENIFCRCDELGRAAIIGLNHVNSWDYLIMFADRLTKFIEVSNSGTEINLNESVVSNNFNEKYTLFGAISSPHKVFWMLAAELLQPHDIHTWANSSVIVTIATFSLGNCPLELLTSAPTDSLSREDCQEALRVRWFKEVDVNPHYLELVGQSVGVDAESQINLRKRLIYLGAKSGSLKIGHESQSLLFLEEFRYIRSTLVAIGFYRSFMKLKRNFQEHKSITTIQANAMKHFKVGIREFLLTPMPEEYDAGLENLRITLEEVTMERDVVKCMNPCQMCQKELNETNLTCPEGHEIKRCILTNFQVFILNEGVCSQCDQVILNDRVVLTEILLLKADEEVICPVCDIPIKVAC